MLGKRSEYKQLTRHIHLYLRKTEDPLSTWIVPERMNSGEEGEIDCSVRRFRNRIFSIEFSTLFSSSLERLTMTFAASDTGVRNLDCISDLLVRR